MKRTVRRLNRQLSSRVAMYRMETSRIMGFMKAIESCWQGCWRVKLALPYVV